jgi:glycosyltransferase involved in cell wall biosynthesis
MEKKTIVSIVTPCLNAEKYIQTTIESVINQTAFSSGKAELDYIIVDGGSKDKTLNIIYDTINNHKLKKSIRIISEPDNGMYDALVKGMKCAYGDIFAYINADDYYNITAIDVVVSIMEEYPVKWLTGWAVGYNEHGHITGMDNHNLFRRNFIAKGIYGTKLPHIQQESTFWREELNECIDYEKLKALKYAGDYYLWVEFSRKYSLFIVETYLGGFRSREEQLSKQITLYNDEKHKLLYGKVTFFDNFLAMKDKMLFYIKKMNSILNCIKNEEGKYVHFVYENDTGNWVPLSKSFLQKKIKKIIFNKRRNI